MAGELNLSTKLPSGIQQQQQHQKVAGDKARIYIDTKGHNDENRGYEQK